MCSFVSFQSRHPSRFSLRCASLLALGITAIPRCRFHLRITWRAQEGEKGVRVQVPFEDHLEGAGRGGRG